MRYAKFEGNIYYVALAVSAFAAAIALYCTVFEYRFLRNRWYLLTNAVAFVLNGVSIGAIMIMRTVNDPVSDIIVPCTIALTQILMLLLIYQNSLVLGCFSFLNRAGCEKVIACSKRFLQGQVVISFVTTTLMIWATSMLVKEQQFIYILIYSLNSSVIGVFLICQTTAQNAWISYRVYNVRKTMSTVEAASIQIIKLVAILGSCLVVDWYYSS